MKYMLHCVLSGEVSKYHTKIRDEIADKFGLDVTKRLNLPAHFTLKYAFETEEIDKVSQLIEDYCKVHKKAKIAAGGFGAFIPKVVYMKVMFSQEAWDNYNDLIEELRKLDIRIGRFEGSKLNPHITLAQECYSKLIDALNFAKTQEKTFECWFDNITIMKKTGEEDRLFFWDVYKGYPLG